jgi:hypothetical protein
MDPANTGVAIKVANPPVKTETHNLFFFNIPHSPFRIGFILLTMHFTCQ